MKEENKETLKTFIIILVIVFAAIYFLDKGGL